MKQILALCCVAAGLVGFSATGAQAAETVSTLPSVAHINETVVVVHRHHHRHGHYVWRHHHRVWVSNY